MAGIKKSKSLSRPDCVTSLSAVGDAFYVIGGKWKLRIIIALSEGPMRFNELQRTVEGISARIVQRIKGFGDEWLCCTERARRHIPRDR